MNAGDLDKRMNSGGLVALNTQRYGTVVCRIIHRTPQQVWLQATGNLIGTTPWMMKLSNIQRMLPADVARRFLPPGAVLTVKPYDVLPANEPGMTPNEILTAIVRQLQPAETHVVQQAILVYEHAQAWLRKNIMAGTHGNLFWLNQAMTRKLKGRACHPGSVTTWLGDNGVYMPYGFKLYEILPSKVKQAEKIVNEQWYRDIMTVNAQDKGSVNSR